MTRAVFEELMAYRSAFGLVPVPEAGEEYGLLLFTKTRPVAIGSRLVSDAKSRRYFRAWDSLTSRKTLYAIVKGRLDEVAASLEQDGRGAEAAQLRDVSPHWLRHTFAKALIVRGRDIRVVAESLGHASVTTTMAYTRQSALDQVREYGKDEDHDLATQVSAHTSQAFLEIPNRTTVLVEIAGLGRHKTVFERRGDAEVQSANLRTYLP
jgi:hypothetical protein